MPSRLGRAWRSSAWRLVLPALVALACGWWLHAIAQCLLAVAIAALAYGMFRLTRLGHLLASRHRLPAADGAGIWDEIQNLFRRRQRAAVDEKRRLVRLLRAFRDAAAAMPDAVVALDREQRIQWFNTAAGHLLGLKYPNDIGGPLTNLVRAPRFAEWLRAESAEPLTDLAAPVDENVRLSLRLIRYAGDRALLVARDVSQLMRLEQVRRDFVANVSHELRTPLTVVHGYLDMIEPESMPEYEPILHELRNQSRRMTQIVEDLLTLSRLEAQGELPQERISLRSLLEALRREAVALSQSSHAVTTELIGKHDLSGSTKELHSAFSNLVSNAVRYTPAGGRITLRWESDANGGRLSVIDTGQGIAPQHLPRLTERFYRVSTSRSRETGGTGLGLSIVKHVLQLHQAHLEIRSEPGVGSTFTCVFGRERLLEPLALAEAP
ncbi:phosphate regulon sensor histidine kinase PhoR [Dokdonella soli]|uniref:Phosphate regulon sensor protein PhoR n=1 Tax=Dokdonella soli TaxID=529810 RepID=A0ABN1IC60_9GAMM